MPLEFKEISWTGFALAGRKLLEEHAKDFAISDIDRYIGPHQPLLDLESQGDLLICVAENSTGLEGHICWKLGFHQGLQARVAWMGPWYIRPKYRGQGLRLYKYSLERLRKKEARFALPTLPLKKQRKTPFGRCFEMTYLVEL